MNGHRRRDDDERELLVESLEIHENIIISCDVAKCFRENFPIILANCSQSHSERSRSVTTIVSLDVFSGNHG